MIKIPEEKKGKYVQFNVFPEFNLKVGGLLYLMKATYTWEELEGKTELTEEEVRLRAEQQIEDEKKKNKECKRSKIKEKLHRYSKLYGGDLILMVLKDWDIIDLREYDDNVDWYNNFNEFSYYVEQWESGGYADILTELIEDKVVEFKQLSNGKAVYKFIGE